jgi:ArsR family transcriptional regulator, arsenate/arsenite/antimonite-responsive transcriptional repressor
VIEGRIHNGRSLPHFSLTIRGKATMATDISGRAALLQISEREIRAIARCLTCYSRQTILRQLGSRERVPLAQLRRHLSVGPATLSHHVEQLENAGLIEIERVGKHAFVRLRGDVLESFGDWVAGLVTHHRDLASCVEIGSTSG